MNSLGRGKFGGVVFVFRDASAIRASQHVSGSYERAVSNYRAHFKFGDREFIGSDLVETWANAAEIIASECDLLTTPWVSASYESTLQSRRISLLGIFRSLGLDESLYQYFDAEHEDRAVAVPWDGGKSTFPIDGNQKYFVMPGIPAALRHLTREARQPLENLAVKSARFGRRKMLLLREDNVGKGRR